MSVSGNHRRRHESADTQPTTVYNPARMGKCQCLKHPDSYFSRDVCRKHPGHAAFLGLGDAAAGSVGDDTPMATIRPRDKELVHKTGYIGAAGMLCVSRGEAGKDLALRAAGRGVGDDDLEGDESVLLRISGQPHSRVAAEAEFVDNFVAPAVVFVSDMDWMIASRGITFKVLGVLVPLVSVLRRSRGFGHGMHGDGGRRSTTDRIRPSA